MLMQFLMHEKAQQLLRGMWMHRWLAIAAVWLVCVAGWIAVAMLPTQYESTARVYVNTDPILTPLLKGLAADTDPGRQVDYMKHTLLSRPNLEEALRLAGLDPGDEEQRRALIKHLALTVHIDPITANLLALSYRDKSPTVAKNVVQSLLTIFAEKTTGTGRQEMDSAEHFLDGEVANYQQKLRELEAKTAKLNAQYPDLLPIDKNGSRLDQARNELSQLRLQLSDGVVHRDALQKQIAALAPTLTVSGAPQVVVNAAGQPESITERIAKARRHLDELRLQFTDQYPDVITTRQELVQLEAEAKHAGSGSSAGGTVKSQVVNPLYDQLKIRLVDAETNIASIERKLADARAEEARAQTAVRAAPDVLIKSQDLMREYGITKSAYDSLVQRRQAAQIADAADTKTDRIQFRIVDPPEIPTLPVAPNRLLFDSAVLLIGIGAGFAVPLALTQLDRSVATIGQLRDFGVPVVGSVSLIYGDAMRRYAMRQLTAVAATGFVLLMAYGGLLLLQLPLLSTG